jgi:hypothetical protein
MALAHLMERGQYLLFGVLVPRGGTVTRTRAVQPSNVFRLGGQAVNVSRVSSWGSAGTPHLYALQSPCHYLKVPRPYQDMSSGQATVASVRNVLNAATRNLQSASCPTSTHTQSNNNPTCCQTQWLQFVNASPDWRLSAMHWQHRHAQRSK